MTGYDVSCSLFLSSFANNILVLRTGKYRHKARTQNGKIEIEVVTVDYQSVAGLFVNVVSQLKIEALAVMPDVLNIIAGDNCGLGQLACARFGGRLKSGRMAGTNVQR